MFPSHTEVRVRPGRPSDWPSVAAFTADTFEWGDYIDSVWESWLSDPDGQLLVVEAVDTAVAIAHVRLLGPVEAWLEGMRVHPDWRRLGIADRLNHACRAWAIERGATVARLATEPANAPARRQVERLGWRAVGGFVHWQPAAAAAMTGCSAATQSSPEASGFDHAPAPGWVELATGPARRAGAAWARGAPGWPDGLVPIGWAFRRGTPEDVPAWAARGRAWALPEASAPGPGGHSFQPVVLADLYSPWLVWLDDRARALSATRMGQLMAAARIEVAVLPDTESWTEFASRSGLRPGTGQMVYAYDLRSPVTS